MKNLDLTRLSVLIVEKHPPMRSMLRGILRELGIRKVEEASSPKAGFEKFTDKTPDLILIDWAPDFDGIWLLDQIRSDETSFNPFAPVIMVTAHSEMDRVIEARDAGMTEYLTKPVSAKRLYQRISAIAESDRQFVRASDFFGPDRRRKNQAITEEDRRVNASDTKDAAA